MTTGKPQRYAIVGMQHIKPHNANAIIRQAEHHQEVYLVTEPGNKYDPNAVQVWIGAMRVGYVPKTQNAVLSKFINQTGVVVPPSIAMDSTLTIPNRPDLQSKMVTARIHKGNNTYPLVEIA